MAFPVTSPPIETRTSATFRSRRRSEDTPADDRYTDERVLELLERRRRRRRCRRPTGRPSGAGPVIGRRDRTLLNHRQGLDSRHAALAGRTAVLVCSASMVALGDERHG
ncbi:hypothetical protein [Haloarchaeobius sp. HRN-SO-5]|uniref:hypothetical protein n=1 Tax=Haloarchaeobius sp. HRN-SO-5 TaxID=3446118 RepID=UPI003EBDD282